MKIAIISAMKIEIDQLLSMVEQPQQRHIGNITYTQGQIYDKQVVLAQCSPGKVNAAIYMQTLLIDAKPDQVINLGVAGAMPRFSIGDAAIADSFVQHDFDTTALGEPAGLIPGLDMVNMPTNSSIAEKLERAAANTNIPHARCKFASGDQFVTPPIMEKAHQTFGADVFDMEGAAIAQVCLRAKTPYGAIRVISDNGDGSCDYETYKFEAAKRSIEIVKHYLAEK